MPEANHNSASFEDQELLHKYNSDVLVDQANTPIPPDHDLLPNPVLVAQGWERRFMADQIQLKETIQLYKELGFEVHVEVILPSELNEVCGDCRLATCTTYKTIYTRKKR